MLTGEVAKTWLVAIAMAVVTFLAFAGLDRCVFEAAWGHDRKRPDLDQWYGSLQRPGVSPNGGNFSCCSKTDCHTTEAELRGGDWWARLGVKQSDDNWKLLDWVRVPADKVLLNQSNPTGEGVICHSVAWGMSLPGQEQPFNPAGATIWCFVPPTES